MLCSTLFIIQIAVSVFMYHVTLIIQCNHLLFVMNKAIKRKKRNNNNNNNKCFKTLLFIHV